MGKIVAAVGTCHTPYMFTRPPDENPEQLDQAGRAMNELGKVLDETQPDVILFFGADHVETFSVSCVPSFAIEGASSGPGPVVSRTGMPPSRGRTQMLVAPPRFDECTIASPSGENTGSSLNTAPGSVVS